MGQKVHPNGIRLGITKDWNSKWYSKDNYGQLLNEDINVRKYLKKKLKSAAVSKITIDRPAKNARVLIHSARPGVIIGKKGGGMDALKTEISNILGIPVHVNISEVRKPELDSTLVAESVAQQLENRVMFRRAMKRAVSSAMRAGALGVKICISGRLGGAEIARSEWYREGRVPLHTFRADVDYGTAESLTTYKGEVLPHQKKNQDDAA